MNSVDLYWYEVKCRWNVVRRSLVSFSCISVVPLGRCSCIFDEKIEYWKEESWALYHSTNIDFQKNYISTWNYQIPEGINSNKSEENGDESWNYDQLNDASISSHTVAVVFVASRAFLRRKCPARAFFIQFCTATTISQCQSTCCFTPNFLNISPSNDSKFHLPFAVFLMQTTLPPRVSNSTIHS